MDYEWVNMHIYIVIYIETLIVALYGLIMIDNGYQLIDTHGIKPIIFS